jgi:glycosyltransferase involved in cell wall biosynthesis
MKISICIPTLGKRRLRYLDEAVRSVTSQSHKDWEIVIADGDVKEPLNHREELTGNIKYLNHKDSGIFEGANWAIQNSSGQVLCFMGDDDKLAPGALETVAKVFSWRPSDQPMWAYGQVEYIDASGQPTGTKVADQLYSLADMNRGNCLATPAVFWNRAIMNETGGFDEFLALADYDLFWWFWKTVEPIYIGQTLGYYRVHRGTFSFNNRDKEEADILAVKRNHNANIA